MYKILKEKGNNRNIVLENTETKASIIIGKLTMPIMGLLEKEITFDESKEDTVKLKDEWNFDISEDLGKALAKTTMPISKPVRDQSKKAKEVTKEQTEPKKKTKTGREVVDVFDLIFGTEN